MIHYTVLLILTIVIFYLAFKIWKKTHDVSFLLGIAVLYYWSLLGAWFIIYDSMTGNAGKEFGLHYYYLLDKMFPVNVDTDYLLSIFLYGLFIISIEVTLLFTLKKFRMDKIDYSGFKPLQINHTIVILISIVSIIASFWIILPEMKWAIENNMSIYTVTRMSDSPFFILHRLLNEYAIIPLFIGFMILVSGKDSRLINGNNHWLFMIAYVFVILIAESYLLLLGNKNEMLFTGIFCVLLYLTNVQQHIKVYKIIVLILIFMIPLFLTDTIRSFKPEQLIATFDGRKSNATIPEMEPAEISASSTLSAFAFSNEMFAGHFSMYGVLSKDVPFTYGSSIVSLVAAIVPRILWPDRPQEVYYHYAKSVGAKPGQGYSMNQATGWYINFGVFGILLGAFILGRIWSWTYNSRLKILNEKRKIVLAFYIVATCSVVAQMPNMIRGGPEYFKPLIMEAFFIPVLVIFLAIIFFRKKDAKINNEAQA
ncbi:MAG: hypothetical protein V2A54_18400 [Bacteroidota bacterium]